MNFVFSLLTFLINVVFDFYIMIMILKILLQRASIDYYNPLNQLTIRLTNPIKFIYLGKADRLTFWRVDFVAIIFIIILNAIKLWLIPLHLALPNFAWLFGWAAIDLIHQAANLFFWLIIILAIFSWISPAYRTPIVYALDTVCDPILSPFRRFIPRIAGFDFSALAGLLIIKLIDGSIIIPLMSMVSLHVY